MLHLTFGRPPHEGKLETRQSRGISPGLMNSETDFLNKIRQKKKKKKKKTHKGFEINSS